MTVNNFAMIQANLTPNAERINIAGLAHAIEEVKSVLSHVVRSKNECKRMAYTVGNINIAEIRARHLGDDCDSEESRWFFAIAQDYIDEAEIYMRGHKFD